MERIMVNLAKVNRNELAEETGVPTEHVEKVVEQLIVNHNNHKRQPREPAPKGGISISEGSRKYKVPKPTIWRWVNRDRLIPILLPTTREHYIDEAELAKLADIYRQNPGRGKWTVRKYMLG